jgi:hypothetical protein
VHDWVVYRFGVILGSVGHRVKIHKITPPTGKERGDLEIKDYVVFQQPKDQNDRLPPPRTLILDFTLTHTCFGTSHVHSTEQLTHTRRLDGAPEPDGDLKTVSRKKILHYRHVHENCIFISQTLLHSYQLQLTLQTTSTMTLVVYFFYMVTVNHRLCLTKYRRNRVNFVCFVLPVYLTLRVQWG